MFTVGCGKTTDYIVFLFGTLLEYLRISSIPLVFQSPYSSHTLGLIGCECVKGSYKSMVVDAGSPKRWDRWHSPSSNWQEKYHLYTTYSPCLRLGVKYATYLPPFRGTISTTIKQTRPFAKPELTSESSPSLCHGNLRVPTPPMPRLPPKEIRP